MSGNDKPRTLERLAEHWRKDGEFFTGQSEPEIAQVYAVCAAQLDAAMAAHEAEKAAPVPPVLMRDVAELLGVTVRDVSAALVALGYRQRSTNMAIGGEEAVSVARHIRAAAHAAPVAVPRESDAQLMTFYQAADLHALIDAMEHQIIKLQARLERDNAIWRTRNDRLCQQLEAQFRAHEALVKRVADGLATTVQPVYLRADARTHELWVFDFDNGTTAWTRDPAEAARIKRYLHDGETVTEYVKLQEGK